MHAVLAYRQQPAAVWRTALTVATIQYQQYRQVNFVEN